MIAYCVVTSLHTAQHCGTVPVLRRSSRLQLGSSIASGSLLPDDDDVNVFNKPDNTDEDDDDLAIFTEPGGEFELDMVRVDELVASYEAAEARWEAAAGIPRALGVLEDRGSQLHEWWHDPVDGPVAQARTYYAAVRHERMLRPVVLLLLVGSCLVSAFVAPACVAAVSVRLGLGVHLAWPAMRLCVAALARLRTRLLARGRDDALAPRVDATHVLSAQHLLGASVVLSLSALEWQCGSLDLALWLGSLGRLSLWPGLWCWRDLHAELLVRAPESAAHAATRFWRLGATALLLSEAALLGRLALALPTTAPAGPTALLALPGALGAAAASLVLGPTARMQARLTAVLAPLLEPPAAVVGRLVSAFVSTDGPSVTAAGAAAAAGAGLASSSQLARLGVLAIGRAAQLICLFYLLYWIAFAIEAGERTAWRPSLRPRQAESCTLSAALLRASSLVRPPLSLEELRREQGVRSGLVPAVFDESAPAPMGFSSAAEAEDRMLQMWSFGPGDLVDVDGTGMGASLLKLWNPTGVRRQRGEGGNVPMEAANAGDSTYYDRGLGEGAGFFELGRLFLAETAPTPSKGVVPEAMRWTRNESEKALRASVANWTNLQLTNLQAGREGEGVREGRAEILSEIAWMQYGLINYANDKPPGYTMPEIDLVNSTAAMPSELQQTRKQYERASKRGRGGREAQAEQWMATGAAPVDGATGAAFWGRNSTAATDPRVAVLLEDEEEEV
jgi:hypothetical protein